MQQNAAMSYIIALGMLIGVAGWLISVYQHLHHLRTQACRAWLRWVCVTRRRNEQINSFVNVFSGFLPKSDQLPRDLLRLAEDSERHLNHLSHQRPPGINTSFPTVEPTLRRMIDASLRTLEQNERMRNNDQLIELCGQLCLTLRDQEQKAGTYNNSATSYNDALQEPSARFVAPIFGLDCLRILR